MSMRRALLSALLCVAVPAGAFAQAKAEPLVDKVRDAIDKGILYLKKQQQNRGGSWDWENTTLFNLPFEGGTTCLTMYALLTAGVPAGDPVIARALPFVRALETDKTYVVALQTMVLAEVGDKKDFDILQKNAAKLLRNRVYANGKFDGWSYQSSNATQGDGSNTQYAVLGLWAAKNAGVDINKIDAKAWESLQTFYKDSQNIDPNDKSIGYWTYYTRMGGHANPQTMTAAGICGLVVAAQQLNVNVQGLDLQTGIAKNCGIYEADEHLERGLRWLGLDRARNFSFNSQGHSFYNVYGIERVGRLTGRRFIGDHDWYREGCEALVGVNTKDYPALGIHEDGSWAIKGGQFDSNPVWSTSFALLFLSKGRTPILVSKLAFNARNDDELSWNNKHNDTRHMVEYASRDVFKKLPLAWQIYDPRKTRLSDKAVFDEELSGLAQSPILYITGHKKPVLTTQQVELLKRYVEEGGFIFGHACCGSKEFTDGFRELMKKLYPETPLAPLKPDHPVWTSHAIVKPTTFDPPLEGIERGCKTIVMFSPAPLAGYWEEERFMPGKEGDGTEKGRTAFRLAGNIIAYATGLEAPQPRLTRRKIVDLKDEKVQPRHQLQIAQVKHEGDWQPAPQAMRHLAANMREQFQLDVALRKEDVAMGTDDIFDYRFLYMHGRKKFTVEDKEIQNMRAALKTGGVLFADACCGSKAFDESFREFVKKLYPEGKLERIPTEDYLFSAKLNGSKIEGVKCRTEKADGAPAAEFENMQPFLEGIKEKDTNRWLVIYSKYDVGCALEKHKSSACLGHDFESALKIGSAALLYSLKR